MKGINGKKTLRWETVEAKDQAFWDLVDGLLGDMGPFIGIRISNRMVYAIGGPGDKRNRIITRQGNLEANHPLNQFYHWLSASPDWFIARNGYAIAFEIEGAKQVVYDKFVWVNLLQTVCGGERTAVFVQQAYNIFWGGEAKNVTLPNGTISALEIKNAAQKIETAYKAWLDYVKRHSVFRINKKDDEWYLPMLIQRLDEQRSQMKDASMLWPVNAILANLYLVDKTLCVSFDGNSGAVMGKRFDYLMKCYGFRAQQRAMVIEILQLHQRQLIKQQTESRAAENGPVMSLLGGTIDIFYQRGLFSAIEKSDGSFTGEKKQIALSLEGAEAFKGFLYEVAEGDWEKLCTWAKVAACCHSNGKLFPGVIYLEANKLTNGKQLVQNLLGLPIGDGKYPALSQILTNQAIDYLISRKTTGSRVVVCQAENLKLKKEKWGRLKKLLNGATVSAPDPVLKRKLHKNTAQWIIVGNENTLQALKAQEIPVLLVPDVREVETMPMEVVGWIMTILPLWGFLLMKKRTRKKESIKLPVVDHFFRKRCKVTEEKETFLPARVLYDAYLDFCEKHGYRDRLLFKDFNDIMEENYGQKPVRYHRARNDNKLGYWNIRLLKEEEPEEGMEQGETSRDDFFRRVEQLIKEVLDCFPEFPFWK